jgi:hypothetical protein
VYIASLNSLLSIHLHAKFRILVARTEIKKLGKNFSQFGIKADFKHIPREFLQIVYLVFIHSSVGIATGYGLDDRGSIPGGAGKFSL